MARTNALGINASCHSAWKLALLLFVAAAPVTPVRAGVCQVPNLFPTNLSVGTNPRGAAAGDFNGDGVSDVAVANMDSNNVSILLASGGSFSAAVSYAAGTQPRAVAVADFNRDGKLDLATANYGSNDVSILLGNGNGTFGAATSAAAGTQPRSIAAADFNRDGKQDLAVANYASNDVSILIGNGSGGFAAAVNYSVGTGAYSLNVGDFDRDGDVDLAVANYASNTVSVLMNSGTGTFGSPADYAVGSLPASVAVADFNSDGILDLAVANYGGNTLSILLGSSAGTFAAPVNYVGFNGPASIAVADWNGDGKLDLAVANYSAPTFVYSMTNGNGDGTFGSVFGFAVAGTASPTAILAGNFNASIATDAILVNSGTNNISLVSNANTCWRNCANFVAGAGAAVSNVNAVATGDIDGDGNLDIVAAAADNRAWIVRGHGDGTLYSAVSYATNGSTPTGVAIADLNRDGKPDLVVSHASANVAVLTNNGDGTFAAGVTYAVHGVGLAVVTGDFDGDGKIDIAVPNGSTNDVSILIGNGDGTLQTAVNYAAGTLPGSAVVADFNKDGKLDLAVANDTSANVSVLLGNGNGTFAAAVNYAAGTGRPTLFAADVDNNGKIDLAVVCYGSNAVYVLPGAGNGTFGTAVVSVVGVRPQSGVMADLNVDGNFELAVVLSDGSLSILQRRSSTTFSSLYSYAASAQGPIALGDFNGDDKPDLVVPQGSGNIRIYLNQCPVPDLTATVSHLGNFTQGDTAAPYTVTVSNIGAVATNATVFLNESIPTGLTLASMSGTGWTCSSAACSRTDALAPGSSYPDIAVMVNVASNAPSSLFNSVGVSGGGEVDLSNNYAADNTIINPALIAAPAAVVATATSTSQIAVTWNAVTGAAGYFVLRKSFGDPIAIVGFPVNNAFTDNGLPAATSYVYQVRAVDASNNIGPLSAPDVATTVMFTDDPIVAGSTVIKAAHWTQLQTAVNAVRAAAGLQPAAWTNTIVSGATVKGADLMDLQAALSPARSILVLPQIVFTDPFLVLGVTTIKAANIQELRNGVR